MMNADFARAILKGEKLEIVRKRLCEIEYNRNRAMIDSIMSDFRDADAVLRGLKEDKSSFTYRLAAEFLKDAENQENQKDEQLKSFEASRQRIEENYIQKLEEQSELIAKENDLKRRQIAALEHNFVTRRS